MTFHFEIKTLSNYKPAKCLTKPVFVGADEASTAETTVPAAVSAKAPPFLICLLGKQLQRMAALSITDQALQPRKIIVHASWTIEHAVHAFVELLHACTRDGLRFQASCIHEHANHATPKVLHDCMHARIPIPLPGQVDECACGSLNSCMHDCHAKYHDLEKESDQRRKNWACTESKHIPMQARPLLGNLSLSLY